MTEIQMAVIMPAAGVGSRFSQAGGEAMLAGAKTKLEIDLAGQPVFLRAIEPFLKRPEIAQIVLAVNPDGLDEFKFKWGDRLGFHDVNIIAGGTKERWETVMLAMQHVPETCTHIAVHDAVRPLTSRALVDRMLEAAKTLEAAIPGLLVASTLRRVEADSAEQDAGDPLDAILGSAGRPSVVSRKAIEVIDRANVVEVQTPQVFAAPLLREAYARVASGAIDTSTITDDAGLIEAIGHDVAVVDGETANIKITRPDDVELARAVMQTRRKQDASEMAKKKLFSD